MISQKSIMIAKPHIWCGTYEVTDMTYQTHKQNEQAIADQWLADNVDQIEAVEEQSYAEQKGFEVPTWEGVTDSVDSIIDQIADDEAQCDDYWEFEASESSTVEEAGKFNVITLAHWQGKVITDQATGSKTGEKLIPKKYLAHQKKQAGFKSRFCIEFCYSPKTNRVRKTLPSNSEIQTIKEARIVSAIKSSGDKTVTLSKAALRRNARIAVKNAK